VLDEHRLSVLSPAERSKFDAHLADCPGCFSDVSAERLLLNETSEKPSEGLLRSILANVPADPAPSARRESPFTWQLVGGVAAMAAVALLFVFATTPRAPELLPEDTFSDTAVSNGPEAGSLLAQPFTEGEHFVALPEAGRFADLGDRISAWVYFMWSCLHCYELESALSDWIARVDPASVDATRVPVVWNEYAELHARAFYTASLLGVSAPVSDAFFAAIHENGNYLDTRAAIQELFFELGIDPERFDATFDSERVDDLLRLARFSAAEAQIDATPTMVIGGIYKTSPAMAGSQERMLEVADWLIDRLRSGTGQSPSCEISRDSAAGCE
jgi:thiol:disulfide interchange protein DsbA